MALVDRLGKALNGAPILLSSVDAIADWARGQSLWAMPMGTACCAMELIAASFSKFDFDRLGTFPRPDPRHTDVMIIAGTITRKMAPAIKRLYDQMPEPKYVVAMGACASGGGPFKEGYSVVSGVDTYIPVDVYIPGCPPTPQALLNGLIALQKKIDTQSIKQVRWYQKEGNETVPIPVLGPDVMDPRQYDLIKTYTQEKLDSAAETNASSAPAGEAA